MAKKKRKLTAWQRHVKSYMATHKGLSFKEALPKAKLTYRRGSNPARPRVEKPRKVKRKMAKKKRRRSRSITVPMAVLVPMVMPAGRGIQRFMEGDLQAGLAALAYDYLGIRTDGNGAVVGQDWAQLTKTMSTIVVGGLIHKFVGGAPLNVNRILARANVPFIRI